MSKKTEPMVEVTIPAAHWNQIVDDIENMCGTSAKHIEILCKAKVKKLVTPNA